MSRTWIRFLNHLLLCRTSDEEVKTELLLKDKKGEQIPAVLLSSPVTLTTKNGALLYQTAIIDLRALKSAEAKLRTSEQRYKTLFELVPVAVYTCDADGIIQEYNPRAVELWGREPERNGEESRFCGSHKIYYPDGRPMPHEKCPTARALRGEKLRPERLGNCCRTSGRGKETRHSGAEGCDQRTRQNHRRDQLFI